MDGQFWLFAWHQSRGSRKTSSWVTVQAMQAIGIASTKSVMRGWMDGIGGLVVQESACEVRPAIRLFGVYPHPEELLSLNLRRLRPLVHEPLEEGVVDLGDPPFSARRGLSRGGRLRSQRCRSSSSSSLL